MGTGISEKPVPVFVRKGIDKWAMRVIAWKRENESIHNETV